MNNTNIVLSNIVGQGNSYRMKGEYDLALKEFEEFVKSNPHSDIAWLEWGKTYKMMNRCPEAIQRFIHAVRINPKNKEAIVELGETARLSESYELAMSALKEIIDADGANEYAHIELGKIYRKIDAYDSALEELNRAYVINPNNSDTLLGLGQVYKSKGRNEEAIKEFKEAVENDLNNKEAHIELGRAYKEQKDFQAAIDEFRSAVDLAPLDAKIRLNLVGLYAQQGRYDLSDEEAGKTLGVVPSNPFLQDTVLNEIEILQGKTILESRVKRLWVTVTSRCNIKCRTCGLWSNPWDLPRKTAEEVMALYPFLERIVWLGGEVFLYAHFDELFARALEFPNIRQQIITNGVILTEEWINRILRWNVELTFSVDGVTKEVYEYIRRGASFERLIKNIQLTNDLRQKYHSKTKLRLNTLIMRSNYHQIEEFIEFARRYNFDQLSFLAVHFDEDPSENILYSKKDVQALEFITTAIRKVKGKAKDYNIDLDVLLPTIDLNFDQFQHNDTIAQQNEGGLHCRMPWKYLFICDEGTVYLTGSCIKRIGNINEDSIAEIWNSEGARLYRESMLRNQFQGICRPECMTRWEV